MKKRKKSFNIFEPQYSSQEKKHKKEKEEKEVKNDWAKIGCVNPFCEFEHDEQSHSLFSSSVSFAEPFCAHFVESRNPHYQ
jgi:hypothetical protein